MSTFQSDGFQPAAFQQTNPAVSTGGMCYGQRYYGQGIADATPVTVLELAAVATTTATISTVLLITQTLSAVATTTASVTFGFFRTLETTVTTTGSFVSGIVLALNIKKATTKLLSLITSGRLLTTTKETVILTQTTATKDTTES